MPGQRGIAAAQQSESPLKGAWQACERYGTIWMASRQLYVVDSPQAGSRDSELGIIEISALSFPENIGLMTYSIVVLVMAVISV